MSHPDGETDGETWKRTSMEWLGFPFELCDEEGDDEENQERTRNAVDSLRLGRLRGTVVIHLRLRAWEPLVMINFLYKVRGGRWPPRTSTDWYHGVWITTWKGGYVARLVASAWSER
ncbi:hypothetical protein MMC22_011222 [Lobaria immixta]|nr:hypothetical protein [Lobaria immixta]